MLHAVYCIYKVFLRTMDAMYKATFIGDDKYSYFMDNINESTLEVYELVRVVG